MVSTVDFDIMAHLTCPFRYIVGKYGICVDTRKYESQISKILDCIIEKSICMEINTSGIGTAFGVLMPEKWIIEKYKAKGGYLISLGSDAHAPENAGKGFDSAISLLKSLGFEGYYYFEKRERVFCKFE
jgi:histidinol-phosphatase (PHP family)